MTLDITHEKKLEKIVHDHKINMIINYAAILSLEGEKFPEKVRSINLRGLENVLDIAIKHKCS